jgi:hypothetical protein
MKHKDNFIFPCSFTFYYIPVAAVFSALSWIEGEGRKKYTKLRYVHKKRRKETNQK